MAENKWQKCPLIENCQQKSAVCNVMLPDESCSWFRWFRALDNPWHTGTPTEEGWYLYKGHDLGGIFYDTEYLPKGFSWQYPNDVDEWMLLDK